MYSLILLAALSGGADAPANVGGCNGGFGYGAGWGYNGGWDIYGTDFLYTEY